MADIFISYKKEDRELAERVVNLLRAEGREVWWDDGITPHQAWDDMIEQEINAVEEGLSSIRAEADSAQSELSKHEVKVAETRARVQFLSEEVTREFQADIAQQDWRKLLWHADDEPEGMKDLDLDEDESEDRGQKSEDQPVGTVALNSPSSEATQSVEKPKRRKRKENKGEPTEDDLKSLDVRFVPGP